MLRDSLTPGQAEQLQSIMMSEPVFPGDTIAHYLARELSDMGLIERNSDGDWVVRWGAIPTETDDDDA